MRRSTSEGDQNCLIPQASLKSAEILTSTTRRKAVWERCSLLVLLQASSPLPLLGGCFWKPRGPSGCMQMTAHPISQPAPLLSLPWSLFLHNLSMTWLCHLSSVKLVFYHPWNYIHLGNISSYYRGECILVEGCDNSRLHWAIPPESSYHSAPCCGIKVDICCLNPRETELQG